jgi:hypothetical protein
MIVIINNINDIFIYLSIEVDYLSSMNKIKLTKIIYQNILYLHL